MVARPAGMLRGAVNVAVSVRASRVTRAVWLTPPASMVTSSNSNLGGVQGDGLRRGAQLHANGLASTKRGGRQVGCKPERIVLGSHVVREPLGPGWSRDEKQRQNHHRAFLHALT